VQATWILVADRVRARLFCASADGRSLIEMQDFVNPDGRAAGRELTRDARPRTMESLGNVRHVIEPHTGLEDRSAERFARELNEVLEQGLGNRRYERLILTAPPHFLGTLQHALGKQVGACVVAHLDKDLTTLPKSEIQCRVATIEPQITVPR
jgi:protein required for attachment to host cells